MSVNNNETNECNTVQLRYSCEGGEVDRRRLGSVGSRLVHCTMDRIGERKQAASQLHASARNQASLMTNPIKGGNQGAEGAEPRKGLTSSHFPSCLFGGSCTQVRRLLSTRVSDLVCILSDLRTLSRSISAVPVMDASSPASKYQLTGPALEAMKKAFSEMDTNKKYVVLFL